MQSKEQRIADQTAVAELVRKIYASYLQYDPALLERCDAPECTIWDLFEPHLVRGGNAARAEFRKKDMADSQRRGRLTIDIDEPIVDVWGDFAVARYYLSYEFKPPGALKGRVRVTTVARRVDGEWRRVHHHEGAVPTGRPGLTNH